MMTRRDLRGRGAGGVGDAGGGRLGPIDGPSGDDVEQFRLGRDEGRAHGDRREASVFSEPTATLDQLAVHVTTVKPGERSHDPHRHWEEELIIVKEGTLESMQNGETVDSSGPAR